MKTFLASWVLISAVAGSAGELKVATLDLQRVLSGYYKSEEAAKDLRTKGHVSRTHERLLDDILKATNRIGENEGFHLILNASKSQPATSDVLFARAVEDLTPKVLTVLNATKPSPVSGPEKR